MGTRLGWTTGRAPVAGGHWTTGSFGLRRGAREDTRYARPPSLHAGAALVAAATPLVATVMLCAALLAA